MSADRLERLLAPGADPHHLHLRIGLDRVLELALLVAVPVGDRQTVTAFGQLSTDSEWVAFTSRDSGRLEIYVQRFLTPSRKWQVSTQGGTRPHWRADGKELFYLGLDNVIYAVPVALGATPTFGSPTKLFSARLTSTLQGATQFDGINVTPDGQRFLVTLQTENSSDAPVTVRVNWPAGLGAGASRP